MNILSRDLTRARRRTDALTDDVQDDPCPAQVAADDPAAAVTRDQRLAMGHAALRRASLELDTALAIARADDVPFLKADLPQVQENVDMLVVGLRGYRRNERGEG